MSDTATNVWRDPRGGDSDHLADKEDFCLRQRRLHASLTPICTHHNTMTNIITGDMSVVDGRHLAGRVAELSADTCIEVKVDGDCFCFVVVRRGEFQARSVAGQPLFWSEFFAKSDAWGSFKASLGRRSRFFGPGGVLCELRPVAFLWLGCFSGGEVNKLTCHATRGRLVYECARFSCSVGSLLAAGATFSFGKRDDIEIVTACTLDLWLAEALHSHSYY